MGIGYATGDNRAKEAAERALRSPLIETEITGARGILLSIAGGDDLTLYEVNEAAEAVREAATDDTNIIFGATIDDRLNGPDVDHRRRDGDRRRAAGAGYVRHRATGSSGECSSRRRSCATTLGQIEDEQAERSRATHAPRAATTATRAPSAATRPLGGVEVRASPTSRRRG